MIKNLYEQAASIEIYVKTTTHTSKNKQKNKKKREREREQIIIIIIILINVHTGRIVLYGKFTGEWEARVSKTVEIESSPTRTIPTPGFLMSQCLECLDKWTLQRRQLKWTGGALRVINKGSKGGLLDMCLPVSPPLFEVLRIALLAWSTGRCGCV